MVGGEQCVVYGVWCVVGAEERVMDARGGSQRPPTPTTDNPPGRAPPTRCRSPSLRDRVKGTAVWLGEEGHSAGVDPRGGSSGRRGGEHCGKGAVERRGRAECEALALHPKLD